MATNPSPYSHHVWAVKLISSYDCFSSLNGSFTWFNQLNFFIIILNLLLRIIIPFRILILHIIIIIIVIRRSTTTTLESVWPPWPDTLSSSLDLLSQMTADISSRSQV